ncbi:peptidylprolyl isomerase [bacterium]|nr:peptidylprolyl isomerase [bacterium]
MKGVLILLLSLSISTSFAENFILAVVNSTPITYKSIETILSSKNSYEIRVDAVNQKIDNTLQLQKVKELNIEPSIKDINMALLNVAEVNNISIEELRAYPEFSSLKTEIFEKIAILNLQRLITKDITISQEEVNQVCSIKNNEEGVKQIKIAQIIISEIELMDGSEKPIAIKSFLKKISKHISNGASFEAFAKLHSQHPSYVKGGITNWIEVSGPTLKMLDSLKKNEVSQIYLTDFGYAVGIKVDERFVSINIKKCKEELIYLNAEEFYSNWVKDLREDAYIKIFYEKL